MRPEYCQRTIEALKQAVRSFYYLYTYSDARRCMAEKKRLEGELERVRGENERLRKEIEKLRSELEKKRKRIATLEIRITQLKAKLREKESEQRELKKGLPAMPIVSKNFLETLTEHGLIELAKKYLRGESSEILDYLNEDAIYVLQMHRDIILNSEPQKPRKRKKPRKLVWIA